MIFVSSATSAQVSSDRATIDPSTKRFRFHTGPIRAPSYPDRGFSLLSLSPPLEFSQRIEVYLFTDSQDDRELKVAVETNKSGRSAYYAQSWGELIVTQAQIQRALLRVPEAKRASVWMAIELVEQIPFFKAIGDKRLWAYYKLNMGDVRMVLTALNPEQVAEFASNAPYTRGFERSKSLDVIGGYYQSGPYGYMQPHFKGRYYFEGRELE